MKGTIFKFGDDVNTDLIISGRYKFAITDPYELASHVFEDVDRDFYKKVRGKKFFIAAGKNFGCGSSREQAPIALKYAGCQAILARSFARIFYRNAFNLGLPIVECNTQQLKYGDIIEIDLKKGVVRDITRASVLHIKPYNELQQALIDEGGIVNLYRKYKQLSIPTQNP